MSATLNKKDVSRILSDVPKENAFNFYTTEGGDTKIFAISLEDFAKKLKNKYLLRIYDCLSITTLAY